MLNKILPMTVVEPRTSGIESDRSTNFPITLSFFVLLVMFLDHHISLSLLLLYVCSLSFSFSILGLMCFIKYIFYLTLCCVLLFFTPFFFNLLSILSFSLVVRKSVSTKFHQMWRIVKQKLTRMEPERFRD